jgi:hypothetical protein
MRSTSLAGTRAAVGSLSGHRRSGGKDFRTAVEAALADLPTRLASLIGAPPLVKSLRTVMHAISSADPGFGTTECCDRERVSF